MILLINTTDCIHSYSIEYDQITLTLKILFYHCIYQSLTNYINIDSINPIVFYDDNDDENEGNDNNNFNDEYQKKEQYTNKILKRKCFLICLKSGHLLFYDVYRTLSLDNNQENNNISILADRQLIGNIEKCLHVRGTDTIYASITDDGVKKFNIRDLFPSYFTHIQSDERMNTSSIHSSQLKSPSDEQNSNSYSISTLRSLLSFTSFYSSPVTFLFFAHVNSSYWIDTLYTTKTNIDRHTCRLQQPQIHQQQQQQQQQLLNNQQIIPSIDIFDLQTATSSILHTIQFRYRLNRQYLYKKNLFVTLYRYSNEQNDVDQKIEFNQLNSQINFVE
ncbi:unnamed protein product [Rotaria sp. Silwood2]|nr:unnamed protein product [Rotaria sp. Silwood2]